MFCLPTDEETHSSEELSNAIQGHSAQSKTNRLQMENLYPSHHALQKRKSGSQTFSGTFLGGLNLKQLPKQAATASGKQGPRGRKLAASGSLGMTLPGWQWGHRVAGSHHSRTGQLAATRAGGAEVWASARLLDAFPGHSGWAASTAERLDSFKLHCVSTYKEASDSRLDVGKYD